MVGGRGLDLIAGEGLRGVHTRGLGEALIGAIDGVGGVEGNAAAERGAGGLAGG